MRLRGGRCYPVSVWPAIGPLHLACPTLTDPISLSPFETRWLAELVRRHEERHGPLEDRSALVAARTAAPEFETRVLRRATELGAREGWRAAILRWQARAIAAEAEEGVAQFFFARAGRHLYRVSETRTGHGLGLCRTGNEQRAQQ